MRWISVWATVSAILCILGSSRTAPSSAAVVKLVSYNIVKKPIHTVSDKFISFTADPNIISRVAECSSEDESQNITLKMAKSLTPAYFRIAGVNSNRLIFQNNPNFNASENTSESKIFPVTKSDWLKWNNFLSKIGMNVIACVSGETEHSSKSWDLSNTLELISFSDKHNLSLDWQLGYELQKLASPQGKLMGRDVEKLRKILEVFPRYRESSIIGPDMTNFRTQSDAAFVRNYLAEAKDSLDVFTWHPFSKNIDDDDIFEMLSNGMNSMDHYLWIKDGILKSSSKGVVPRKPIWIAESENTDTVSNLSDSMTWIMRMGSAARLGVSVYLRRPHLLSFYEPTPEFWTAILFKSLVGRTVLDIKQISGNGTNKLQMFTHCTKFIEKPEESVINPEISYDPGSITVYGVNMALESTRISFKIGYKGDETAHLYVLTEDTSGNFPKSSLNKQPLNLSPENELPIISPRVRESPKYLLIPARSIFFVVFPNTKCRSCKEYDTLDTSKIKIKIPEEQDSDTNIFTSDALEAAEDENDRDVAYVKFPTRNENLQTSANSSPSLDNSNLKLDTKFIISSEDTWMNRFPEELKDAMKKEKDPLSDAKDKEKAQQYRILAQAITGKRAFQNTYSDVLKSENPATRFVYGEEEPESMQPKRPLMNFGRVRRSSELVQVNETDSKEMVSQNDINDDHLEQNNEKMSNRTSESQMGTVKCSELELTPANVTKSEDTVSQNDINDDYLEQNIEETSSPIAESPMETDYRNVVLYMYDVQGNETYSNETEKPHTLSAMYVVPLYEESLEEAMNTSEFRETIPIVTFVKKSTLEVIIEAAKNRIKRETEMENFTMPSSFIDDLITNISSSRTSTSAVGMNKDKIEEVAELVTDAVMKSSSLRKLFKISKKNGTLRLMNRAEVYNHIITNTLLNKPEYGHPFGRSSAIQNTTSGLISDEDLESDDYQKALEDFDRFKRWTESIPAEELESKQSSFDDDGHLNTFRNVFKRSVFSGKSVIPLNEESLVKAFEENKSQLLLTFLSKIMLEQIAAAAKNRSKRSVFSGVSAIPLNEESLVKAFEENKFRESIPLLTFLSKTMLENIVAAAKNRSKREPTIENSTNSQVSEILTNSSSTLPLSISSDETATQPITSESLLNKTKELSIDIAEEVDKIIKQLIQNDTENQSNSTQKPDLQQTNSSISDLTKESDNSKVQRELREIDADSGVNSNVLGSRKLKPIDKINFRPISPFPKKPKHVKAKSAAKNKSKSSDNVQLNRQDATITSLPETEPVLSSKRQTEESTSSVESKSSNLAKTSKSTDTKLNSEISENLEETAKISEDPIDDISSKDVVPHSKKLHPEETSLLKQVQIEDDSSKTPSNTPTMVGKPILRPATLVDIEKERAKHHRTHTQPTKKTKITPKELQASVEQKRKELLQKYSDRLKEIRNALKLPALLEPHTRAKRSPNIIDDIKNVISEMWSESSEFWETTKPWIINKTSDPTKSWEGIKSWATKESKNIANMINKRDTKHIDEDTAEHLKSWDSTKSWIKEISDMVTQQKKKNIDGNTLEIFLKPSSGISRNNPQNINSEIVVSPHTELNKTSLLQTTHYSREAKIKELQVLMDKVIEDRKRLIIERAKAGHFRQRRDTKKDVENLKELKEKRRISSNGRQQKLAKHVKELKEKIAHGIPFKNKRNLPTTNNKILQLQENKPQQHTKFHQIDPDFPVGRSQIPWSLATNIRSIQPFIRNQRDVQAVQNKIQELRQKKQEHRNLLQKKFQLEQPTSNEHLESSSSQPSPPPMSHRKSEVKHPASNESPLTYAKTSQNKVSKINKPPHQVINKTLKKLHKSPPLNRERSHHRLHKRDVNENQLEGNFTSLADLLKKLSLPQSMYSIKNDDLNRLRRSLNDNEIFDADEETGIKLANKDPEGYHELNKINDVLEPVTSTAKPSIDINISRGNSRFQTYQIKAFGPSQENLICPLSYNVFKYFWCVTEKLWNTYIKR